MPVRNAADCIVARLRLLLDVLPELTPQFEIIVVDDASFDETFQTVVEFARAFRQIATKRHASARGIMAAIRTGWALAAGEFIYCQDPQLDVSPADIKQFWKSGSRSNLYEYSPPLKATTVEDRLLQRLSAWCDALKRIQAQNQQRTAEGEYSPDVARIDQAMAATRSPKISKIAAAGLNFPKGQ